MSTTLATVKIAVDADVVGLHGLAGAIAAACGLPAAVQARVAVAVTEAAASALVHGGGTIAFRILDGEPPCLEVVAADDGRVAVEHDAASTIWGSEPGLALARRAAERWSVDAATGRGTSVVMGWSLPAKGGPSDDFPAPTGICTGAPISPSDVLRYGNRLLGAVLGELRAVTSELEEKRAEVDGLMAELEETNRGLIALHRELEEAREAEARLGAIVRFSDDAMYSIAPDETVMAWNAGAEHLLGYARSEIIGRPVERLMPERARAAFDGAAERLRSGEHAVRYDAWRRRKDGSLVEAAVTLSAIRDADDRLIGFSAVLRDLTDRRVAEAELAAARATQEVLAERDRIARDLHDLVIQRLFASGLALQGAIRRSEQLELQALLRQVVADLDATIVEIRSTIFALGQGPGDPQASGLRAQLLEVSSKAAAVLGFRPSVRFSGPVDAVVPSEVHVHLVAVSREALSNVARHAQATRVEVTLHVGTDIVLTVTDDGRGMGTTTRRSGLANLESRAKALGGTCQVTSEDGMGTRIEWRVPARLTATS